MSRLDEVNESTRQTEAFYNTLESLNIKPNTEAYLANIAAELADISVTLAVIADSLSKEPEGGTDHGAD